MGLSDLNQTNGTKIYQIQIRKIAEKLGHVRYMGVASLGALGAIDDRIDLSVLEQTIKKDEKLHRYVKQNLQALRRGTKSIILHEGLLEHLHQD